MRYDNEMENKSLTYLPHEIAYAQKYDGTERPCLPK